MSVKHMSEWFVQPHYASEESKQPFFLAPADLAMLSVHYIQKGLFFTKPPEAANNPHFMDSLLEKLKHSLALALVHFYPLSGRLVTKQEQDPPLYLVYVDCTNSPGAKFIHASLDLSISEILSPIDVPLVVQSLFDHDRAINHDAHTTSLLTIQVTELVDGVFIGLSMNHCLVDGTSYWHFFNTWSEIFQAQEKKFPISEISRPPVLDRWFPEGHGPIISLPFKGPEEFIDRFEAPTLRERMFHFSSESIAKLKSKANSECKEQQNLFLPGLVCSYVEDNHSSTWSASRSGNQLQIGCQQQRKNRPTAVSELLWELNLSDQVRRCQSCLRYFDPFSVMMGSGPRFDMYGNEFGMGKAVTLRSGYANKFSGKVSSFQGRQAGSIDLEVCLPPEAMTALESDQEFMEVASVPNYDD
ncbi:hypothetical protein M0R45_011948 [Rubus argutus]|uniref:Uncharacterized protein n=1 Tax=Rubus argutus TaxID=59490 RepID=A0AAW1YFX9_RUBAR